MDASAHSEVKGTSVLLIDNYSSFSQNLVHYLAELTGQRPMVLANDFDVPIHLDRFDAVVISPGPGTPLSEVDFGICSRIFQEEAIPVLGICLGHQGLGTQWGAPLTLADEPFHGRSSEVCHQDDPLFQNIPNRFRATRYHSLILRSPLPADLRCIASTDTGEIMAIRHRERPHWGVQFHPESIATEYGHTLLANFCRLAREAAWSQRRQSRAPALAVSVPAVSKPTGAVRWRVEFEVIEDALEPDAVFETLYGDSPSAFWLDGSSTQSISYIGDASGPHGYHLSYDVDRGTVAFSMGREGEVVCSNIFDYLDSLLAQNVLCETDRPDLAFCGGLVGYFGYEAKAALGAVNRHKSEWPDAQWSWVDRFIAYNHGSRRATLVALCPDSSSNATTLRWMTSMRTRLSQRAVRRKSWPSPRLHWRDSSNRYLALIEKCQGHIRAGESYELCLTTQLAGEAEVDGLELFRRMRASNPAAYAAYLRCVGLEIASASPECFLRIDSSGGVESRPIKGTAPRDPDLTVDTALASSLVESEKERAENLMIVDLVRHDLARTCVVGSVEVVAFAALESYSSVHQLVSTVRGQLRPDATPLSCIAAAFPGGSMTGAPKKRSMELLDVLETGPRGPYAGSLGFLSMTGAAHLSIVIRSVLVELGRVHLGVGGAITALSNAPGELDEVHLKAKAQIDVLAGDS